MDATLIVLFLAGFASLLAYLWVNDHVVTSGGKVPVKYFGWPDAIVCGLFVLYFILLSLPRPQRELHESDLVDNAVVELACASFLCSFLYFRGFDMVEQFGLRGLLRPDKTVGKGLLFLAIFLPMFLCVQTITLMVLKDQAKEQELLVFFSDAVRDGNRRAVVYMFVTGVVVAPLVEELIFRGYVYGALKRYLGLVPGVLLNAGLFGAVHGATAFPALFLFAVCLTLAYEFTGCLFVNITMHSVFNLCSLTLAYYQSLPKPHP